MIDRGDEPARGTSITLAPVSQCRIHARSRSPCVRPSRSNFPWIALAWPGSCWHEPIASCVCGAFRINEKKKRGRLTSAMRPSSCGVVPLLPQWRTLQPFHLVPCSCRLLLPCLTRNPPSHRLLSHGSTPSSPRHACQQRQPHRR